MHKNVQFRIKKINETNKLEVLVLRKVIDSKNNHKSRKNNF